jgi:hypothetical protein
MEDKGRKTQNGATNGADDPNPRKRDNPHQKTILQLWFPGLDKEFSNLFGPSLSDGTIHVVGGALKAAVMYWVPVTLYGLARKRRLELHFRRAFGVGVFVGVVRLVDRIIRLHCRKPLEGAKTLDWEGRVRKYHMFVAGFLGGAVAQLVDPTVYQSTLILFWAVVRAARCYLPDVPYGSTVVMCLSAMQILSIWIRHPEELDSGYLRFLNSQGMRTREQLEPLWQEPMNPCGIIHPGKGCVQDKLDFYPRNFFKALKLYFPVYLVMLLFAKKRNPLHFIQNVLRSSTFLATYCTFAWASACVFYRFNGPVNRKHLMMHTWFAGLATLIERDGRRNELAAYCATYALDSIYRKLCTPILSLHWLVLSVCSAIMLHNHTEQPAVLMKWLFKLTGPTF